MKTNLLSLILAVAFMASPAFAKSPTPVSVTAYDLITKVYGLIDYDISREQAESTLAGEINVSPTSEKKSMWLDSDDGFRISYYGMTPKLAAVAYFNDDVVSSYSYYFLFPYSPGMRDCVNLEQSLFTGSLLHEMKDFGLLVGMPDAGDVMFEAMGSYCDRHIHVGLFEETYPDESGRFILSLEVTPGSYAHNDYIMAGI